MQGLNLTNIEQYISKPRLLTYSALCPGFTTDQPELIGIYNWNKLVSSAIYPILQCLEVTLRNSLHITATTHFGSSSWYDPLIKQVADEKFLKEAKKKHWLKGNFFRPGVSGSKKGPNKRRWNSHTENQLVQAKERLKTRGKKVVPDAIVSELMFGFWVEMFESSYRDINHHKKLWPNLEEKTFPHASTSQRDSSTIHSKLLKIKGLRNRLSHHEPVWKDASVTDFITAVNFLRNIIDDALDIIGFMSEDRLKMLHRTGAVDRFKLLCSEESLRFYSSGSLQKKVDKRRLKREISKGITKATQKPVLVTHKGNMLAIVSDYL